MTRDEFVKERINETIDELCALLEKQQFPNMHRVATVLLTGFMMVIGDPTTETSRRETMASVLARILASHPQGVKIMEILREFISCQTR